MHFWSGRLLYLVSFSTAINLPGNIVILVQQATFFVDVTTSQAIRLWGFNGRFKKKRKKLFFYFSHRTVRCSDFFCNQFLCVNSCRNLSVKIMREKKTQTLVELSIEQREDYRLDAWPCSQHSKVSLGKTLTRKLPPQIHSVEVVNQELFYLLSRWRLRP